MSELFGQNFAHDTSVEMFSVVTIILITCRYKPFEMKDSINMLQQ